jgi:hypothetical protein
MTTPDNLTRIAVGSSEYIWALDVESDTVYQRNLITQNFEKVSSNITVASLDVSSEGQVIALDPGGNLYLWDSSTRTFDALNLGQTFDQVNIGNDTIWALRGTTVYQWDDSEGAFVEAFDGATALTVAKQDDAVYILDESGNLQQYQYDVQEWQIITSELGVDDLSVLAATSQDNLWGLTADGKVYQYNSLNLADADAPQATFVPQSANLGIPNTVRLPLRRRRSGHPLRHRRRRAHLLRHRTGPGAKHPRRQDQQPGIGQGRARHASSGLFQRRRRVSQLSGR